MRRAVIPLFALLVVSCESGSPPLAPDPRVLTPALEVFSPGARVIASDDLTVRSSPSASSSILGTQEAHALGTITDGPGLGDGQIWWSVDFESGADGWTEDAKLAWPYFPAPEGAGGWRTLVTRNKTPTRQQKTTIREVAEIDWNKLKLANDYSRSFTSSSRVLVIRNGWVAGEWGGTSSVLVASVSKSLTGLAAARMFDIYLTTGPEDFAYNHLPSTWADADERKRDIRIEHLMTMASGLEPHDNPNQPNYLDIVLSRPVKVPPETEWSYASLPVDLLSIVIQDITGSSVADFFNAQIASPVGIASISWGTFGEGYTRASGGVSISARDLARIGYLMMMNGAWDDGSMQRQVVSAEGAARLRTPATFPTPGFVPTPGSPFVIDSDSPEFYAHLWWTNHTGTALGAAVPSGAYFARGYKETLLVVVPSLNLVVVRSGSQPLSDADFKRQFMARVMAAIL